MIVSHKHKFIFIKTAKTAGTSIEIALSRFCGDGDIITPVSAADERIRRELGFPGPRNFLEPFGSYGIRDLARLALRGKRRPRYFNHIAAVELKALLPAEVWRGYYKFCFERNPWDRVISHYSHLHSGRPAPTLMQYLESGAAAILKKRGYSAYTIERELAVDRVCRYEDIESELDAFRSKVGLPARLSLPNAKSSFRKDRRSYREVLSSDEAALIGEIFRDEIDLMGYTY